MSFVGRRTWVAPPCDVQVPSANHTRRMHAIRRWPNVGDHCALGQRHTCESPGASSTGAGTMGDATPPMYQVPGCGATDALLCEATRRPDGSRHGKSDSEAPLSLPLAANLCSPPPAPAVTIRAVPPRLQGWALDEWKLKARNNIGATGATT